KADCDFLQTIDIGHCFSGFGFDHDLGDCLEGESQVAAEKSGRLAVVLEDDPVQMRAWCKAIETFSKFTLEPGAALSSPKDILALPYDPKIGLYLLDIQNGEDERAGIDVARELIARIHSAQAQWTGDGKPPHMEILVWSSSASSVRAA